MLISKDPNVEQKLSELIKSDPEQPIVIPFTYQELSQRRNDPYFMRNKFIRNFYSRNLFGFLSPLRKDIYFYGRHELVNEIINKHRSGEHTGLFGLRKSGKTSIIYAVERKLEAHVGPFVSIDCESPKIHQLRWFELLFFLVSEYKSKIESKFKIESSDYSNKGAAASFEKDMIGIHKSKKAQPIMLLFDEIERISPKTGSSDHWSKGEDFIFFWQTLRAFYQRNQNKLTYMLVGTNPSSVELPTIGGVDNPLFGSIPSDYVPCFTLKQTREMVRQLGRFMGIKFEEIIYSKLFEDYGGHPFLIRQFCSFLHENSNSERPLKVDKPLYLKLRKEFKTHSFQYLDMIVSVLKEFYPDEYDMLKFHSQGDTKAFEDFASDNSSLVVHLKGYGLISQSSNGYCFNISALSDFIKSKNKFENWNLTQEEQISEISGQRNQLEKKLRIVICNGLRTSYGSDKARNQVLKSLPKERSAKLETNELSSLLSKDASPLYLSDLKNLISREWQIFQNIFEIEKNKILLWLEEINEFGRPDAHAKSLSKTDFKQLRIHFERFEDILKSWSID